ncbi:MAG: hypothetical protein WC455_24775 [Dehalococcoidia bacterium]|jgi:hypothetical protein
MFGRKQEPPKKRRTRTRKDPKAILEHEAQKELLIAFRTGDYETKRAIIKHATGINLPEPSEDAALQEMVRKAMKDDPEYAAQVREAYLQQLRGDSSGDGDGPDSIESIVDSSAIQAIQGDPTLIAGAVKARISEILGTAPQGSLKEMMDQIEQYEALKEHLGGKSGGGFGGVIGDIAKAFTPVVMALIQQGGINGAGGGIAQPQPARPRTYIVLDSNGNPREVPEAEARQLMAGRQNRQLTTPAPKPAASTIISGESKPIDDGTGQQVRLIIPNSGTAAGSISSSLGDRERPPTSSAHPGSSASEDSDRSKTDPSPAAVSDEGEDEDIEQEADEEAEEDAEQETDEQGVGDEPTVFPLDIWAEFMDKEPGEVVDAIVTKQSEGDSDADNLLNIMSVCSADDIITFLQSFAEKPEYAKYVQMLTERRDWLQEVIDCYRASVNG